MTLVERERYQAALSAAVLLVIVGVFLGEQWVVVLAGIPLSFVAFGAVSGVPNPDITVERDIEPRRPIPADSVTVRLTVRNDGETSVPDLRLVDGLPDELTVISGTRALSTSLTPGQEETHTYTVEATRGIHTFEPPRIRVRGLGSDSYREVTPTVHGDTEFAARVFLDEAPTIRETATLVGAVTSDSGGSGIEFHTVRQYRPGDPINRIEWRKYARDGELATINYREYGGLSVFVLADCRPEADVIPGPNRAAGSDLCQYGADRIVHAATDAGHEIGLAVLGPDANPWVARSASDVHVQARTALRSIADDHSWNGPQLQLDAIGDGTELANRLLERFKPGTQVVFVTPLGDDAPVTVVRQLRHHGYRVTVLTPDVGAADSPGKRLVQSERRARISRLRDEGAEVIDWPRSEPLPVTLSAATVGESS